MEFHLLASRKKKDWEAQTNKYLKTKTVLLNCSVFSHTNSEEESSFLQNRLQESCFPSKENYPQNTAGMQHIKTYLYTHNIHSVHNALWFSYSGRDTSPYLVLWSSTAPRDRNATRKNIWKQTTWLTNLSISTSDYQTVCFALALRVSEQLWWLKDRERGKEKKKKKIHGQKYSFMK